MVGGTLPDEVSPVIMVAKIEPGLFLAGEVLDVQGNLDGINIQWAVERMGYSQRRGMKIGIQRQD